MANSRMTDEELEAFLREFHRYMSVELDQFEHWKINTPYGWVYIDISRETDHPEWYDELSPVAHWTAPRKPNGR